MAALQALDMRRLQTLQRVAARGSFSLAAQDLHFTQSAVSQQIATLERDLGVRLVNRNPVSLTEPGRMLCDRYEMAVAELAAAEAELDSFRQGGSGRVRIAAIGAAAARIIPRAAASFASQFPDVLLHVQQHETKEALARLKRGDADIALASGYERPPESTPRLRWIRLTRERIGVALPTTHPLARKPALQVADIEGERFIQSHHTGIPLDTLQEAFGSAFTPSILFDGENTAAVHALVAAGVGLALVPELDGQDVAGVVRLPLVDSPLARSIYAAAPASQRISAAVTAMLDQLVIAARPVPALQRPRWREPRGADTSARSEASPAA
jgi:DNA-binding transcriptional LysR family regulator